MLIVSVGTGTSPDVRSGLEPHQMNLLFNATTIPSTLMYAALNEQDLLCRVFGDCRSGDPLDREFGDLIGSAGPLERQQKLLRGWTWLAVGISSLRSIDGIPELKKVGQQVARMKVKLADFQGFPAV